MLFCVASGTDWVTGGVTHAAAQHMVMRNLVPHRVRRRGFELTDQGRDVLAASVASECGWRTRRSPEKVVGAGSDATIFTTWKLNMRSSP